MIMVNEYKILRRFIKKFNEGYFDLLIVVGEGGLGKTYNIDDILDSRACRINSHVTPKGLMILGYEYRNRPIWFDDVEILFNDDKLVGLMKQFAQTQPVKNIKYLTSCKMKVPREYDTKSKVIMSCNNITRIGNPSIKALLDRGIIIDFRPSKNEIISYINDTFKSKDNEIIDYISRLGKFSLRDYIKFEQLKSAGFKDWRKMQEVMDEPISEAGRHRVKVLPRMQGAESR